MSVNLSDLAEIVPGGGTPTPATTRPGMSLADLHETDPNPQGPGPQTLGQELRRGIQAGTNTVQADLFGLAHLTGSLLGSDTLKNWALTGIDDAAGDAERLQPTVAQMSDIEDGGDFVQWAAGAIGQQIPILGTMIGSGGIVGGVAKVALKSAIRRAIVSAGRRKLAEQATGLSAAEMSRMLGAQLDNPATQRLLRQSFSRGAGYGAGGASFAVQAGDLQNQLTEAGIDSPLTAIAGGAAAAALDAAPAVALLNRMFPGVDTKLAKSFVADMAEAMGTQAALEGSTEAAQEMIMLASRAYHDPSFDISSPANRKQVLNAAAAGALVGGLTGGAGEVVPATARSATRAARATARNMNVGAGRLSDYARAKVDMARRVRTSPTDVDGIAEMRAAASEIFYEEIAPVLSAARTRVGEAVAGVQSALGVQNLGINASKLAEDLDTSVREAVNPILTQANELLHTKVDEAKAAAANLLGEQRVTYLQQALDGIRADVKQFVDKRLKPIIDRAEKAMADKLQTANYDDDETDFDEPDEPGEETGDQRVDDLEVRVGPSGRRFTRARATGVTEQMGIQSTDADRIGESRKVVFGAPENIVKSAKKKDGTVAVTKVSRRTRGDSAKPMTKEDAEAAARNLRKLMPTVNPETITVEQQGDGYVVAAEDIGNADEIYDNVRFLDGIVDAQAGSRLNPTEDRRIMVVKPGAKIKENGKPEETRMDLPTLVLVGEDLAERAGVTLPENRTKRALIGLDTVLARMIDQGYTFPQKLNSLRNKMLFESEGKPMTVEQARSRSQYAPQEVVSAADIREAGPYVTPRPSQADPAARELQKNIDQGVVPMPKPDTPVFERKNTAVDQVEDRADALSPERAGDRGRGGAKQAMQPPSGIKDIIEGKPGKLTTIKEDVELAPDQGQEVDRPNYALGVEQTEEDLRELEKRNPKTRSKRQRPQRAKDVHIQLDSITEKEAEEIGKFVVDVKKLAGLTNRIYVVDEDGLDRMYTENPNDFLVKQAFGAVMRFLLAGNMPKGFIMPYGNEVFIFLSNNTLRDKKYGDLERGRQATFTVLAHELGHLIEFVYFRQIKDDKLRQAIFDDWRTYADEQREAGRVTLPFEEWMANQFAKWMTVDAEPRTIVEKFFDKVAQIMKRVYDQLRHAIGLKPNYQEFARGIVDHAAGRTGSPNPYTQHFFNEGVVGRVFFKNFKVVEDRGEKGEVLDSAKFDVKDIPAATKNRVMKLLGQYPGAKQAAVRTWETISFLHNQFTSSLNGRLRRMELKASIRLANKFNRTPGEQRQDPTYFNAVQKNLGIFEGKFIEALRGATDEEKLAILGVLQSQTPRSQLTGRAAAVAKVFDEMYDYAREAGLPIRKVSDYFPRVWDQEAVKANKEKIEEKLISLGLKPDQAEEVWSKMAGEYRRTVENPEDELDIPFEGFLQKRAQILDDEFFNDFQTTDLDQTIIQYMRGLVKRAEFNRYLGMDYRKANKSRKWNPRGEYDAIIKEALAEGATPDQIREIHDAVDAMLGRYGRDLPVGVRKAMAWIVTYQNMRLLLFSVLSAFPDIVGGAIRSNDWKGTFRTFRKNMSQIMDKNSDLSEMARTWGIISDSLNQHVLTENFDNHWFPENARKLNEAFFRYTGLEKWTNFVRTAALAVGRDFIKRRAVAAQDGDTKAADDLAQLGLTAADVLDWVGDGERVFGKDGNASAADKKVSDALVQFVNESVMRPDASQRPLWASNPALMMLFHLKSFMYAFHNTVARQVYQNMKDAKTPWQKAWVVAGPALMMMAFTALGLELRELIQYRLWGKAAPSDSQSNSEYIGNLALRAGLYGPAQMAMDLGSADEHGQLPLFAVTGPTIQQMNDILSKPASQTVPKAIPIISQMPVWRQALRDLGD